MVPQGQRAKDLMIGKDQDWRDKIHFKSAYGLAWADWLFFMRYSLPGLSVYCLASTGVTYYSLSPVRCNSISIYFCGFLKEKLFARQSAG